MDLSLLPTAVADEVTLQKGGAATLYGNGAIGGTIQLENKASFGQGLSLSTTQELGSFGQYYQNYQVAWSGPKLYSRTQYFRREVENDYTYENTYVRPVRQEVRRNASIQQQGLLQQLDYQLPGNHIVGAKVWLQQNDVQVPETILSGDDTEALQQDDFARGLIYWDWTQDRLSLTYKQAYQAYRLVFTDPSIDLNSNSTFTTWTHRLEGEIDLKPGIQWIGGINYIREDAQVTSFGGEVPFRNRLAIYQSIRWMPEVLPWKATLSVRGEAVDGSSTPIIPALGWEYTPISGFTISGNYSRNYRIPTFNDLFWVGSGAMGNPDLLPETSWSGEQSMQWAGKLAQQGTYRLRATAYTSWVNNWILWRPLETGIWAPDNVKQVWNRGLEASAHAQYTWGAWSFQGDVSYNYVLATNRQLKAGTNERQLGKQLLYTPRHEMSLLLQVNWRGYSLLTTATHTGQQYTDGENTEVFALPAYQLANLSMHKSILVSGWTFDLRGSVNNLLNQPYENRRGYPLPGRNYSVALTIKFQNIP